MNRPNILWIMTDQHVHDALSCADHPTVETPHIDRLAETGVHFTDAYSPAPVCGPARAALFSGLYPQASGFTGNNEGYTRDVRLLPERLRDAGYDTALVGKLHLVPKDTDHGFRYNQLHDAMYDCYHEAEPRTSRYVQWLADKRFDGDVSSVVERANEDELAFRRGDLYRFLMGSNWRSEAEHSNTWVGDRTVEYFREHYQEPFFCFASFFGPHQPMAAPGKYADMYDPTDVPLPPEFDLDPRERPIARKELTESAVSGFDDPAWTEAQYREVLAAYYGQISMIDAQVGRILNALEAEGLAEDTIVVFTADHGDHAGQFGWFFKGTMYERSVRVPLLIREPNSMSDVRTDHVVNAIDLFSTILDYCGVPYDDTHARSLRPLLNNPRSAEWIDETYSEFSNMQMLVKNNLKLIRTMDKPRPVYELYDRTDRPYDSEDLWNNSDLGTRQDELVERLKQQAAEYGTAP